MTRNRPTTLRLGAISEGTLLPADLIEALLWDLERIRLTREERTTVRRVRQDFDTDGGDNPDPYDMYETLTNIAENHLLEYTYFGSLDGDGSCVGVWPAVDSVNQAIADDEIALDSDGGAVANGLVASVTDHGNLTLYRVTRGKRREIWSVV